MLAYLVQARTPPWSNPQGDILIYVAGFKTEHESLAATKAAAPTGVTVEFVIGSASQSLISRMELKLGAVELLI